MDPRNKCGQAGFRPNGYVGGDFSSFNSQSKTSQTGEPTPKKPKLEITKNGCSFKNSNCSSKSVNKDKDMLDDDLFWGDEFNCDEIAQIEETIALTQMSVLSQSNVSTAVPFKHAVDEREVKNYQENSVKRTCLPETKSSPRVPIRRVNSSQWPSSTFSSSDNKALANNTSLLQNELEKLKLENQKLKEEMNKKAGEAKLLRLKMKDSEKQCEKMTQSYLNMTNDLKLQAEQRNSSLLKEIQSLKGQLDVKDMEIKTAEGRAQMSSSVNRIQLDSPIRLGVVRSLGKIDSETEVDTRQLMQGLSLKFIRDSVTPELLKSSPPETLVADSVRSSNPRLFSSEGSSLVKERSPSVRREFPGSHTCITSCAALLLSPSLVDTTSDASQQIFSQVVDVCHKILTELLKQLESTMYSYNRFTERERELLSSGSRRLPLDKDYNFISHKELYSDERGVTARRALGLLSLLVQASSYVANKLLSSNLKDSIDILDTVRNIVQLIEKQRRTLEYQGVLAGSILLIQGLLSSEATVSKETQMLMVDVLRWVVSARPGSLVMSNVLQTLLAAANFPHFIDLLCQNSAEKTFKEDTRHCIIQFSPDSCVLQVVCSVLKALETPRKHRLTDVWTQWVLSLFCSGQPRPRWLSVSPNTSSCQCHSLVCKLCFSLLNETCFAYPSASADDQSLMRRVLARGVLLMNTLMNEDEHLLAIADPSCYMLGCYEHFLHFMSDSKITLDSAARDTLGFLCNQEEVLKQPASSSNEEQNTKLRQSILSFEIGDSGKRGLNVLDEIDRHAIAS